MSANGFGRHPAMPHTRVCRECRRQRTRDYKARQRAASLAAAALGLAA